MTAAPALLVDASVAVKWALPEVRESGADAARELIGECDLHTTTLAVFEVASTIQRIHPDGAAAVGTLCALVRSICGEPLGLEVADIPAAARLAERHGLTFYDASYVAIAQRAGLRLVSADGDLLRPGLAIDVAAALGR